VFRVGIGILTVIQLLSRFQKVPGFYTDHGVLPRWIVFKELNILNWKWSLFYLHGSEELASALFILGFFLALLYIFGIKTFWSGIFLWIIVVSVNNRNMLVTNGGDRMLQILLFWSLFLPAGKSFAFFRNPKNPTEQVSIPAAAFMIQIALIYFFSGLLKIHDIWYKEGTALYYVLNYNYITKPIASTFLQYPKLLKIVTYLVFYLELIGPLLLFMPWHQKFFRWMVCILFILFHLATLIFFELGIFPYIGIVAWIALLPSDVWNNFFYRADKIQHIPIKSFKSIVTGFLIVYVILFNVRSLNYKLLTKFFPTQLNVVAQIFQIQQRWGMFAPYPTKEDGTFSIEAKSKNGSPVNLTENYDTKIWRKYLLSLYYYHRHDPDYNSSLMRYLCSQEPTVKSINLYFLREETPAPDVKKPPAIEKLLVSKVACSH